MWKSLVCVTLLIVTDVVVCKPDYLFNQEVNGWLKLHAVPATWQQAYLNCYYEGAVLASPINLELAAALYSTMLQSELDSPIYMGVTAATQGDFMSLEGVPLADLSIAWGTYVGGTKSENCLSLSTEGKTYISSCLEFFRIYATRKGIMPLTLMNAALLTVVSDYHLHATGSCYKYHKKRTSWWGAQKICLAEGGHLVIINDKQEADTVTDLLDKPKKIMSWSDAVYVGLLDRNMDLSFHTLHGEKVENVYDIWAKGQPDNKGFHQCGIIYPEGTLDDIHCDNSAQRFICEKDPNTSRFENISGEVYEAGFEDLDPNLLLRAGSKWVHFVETCARRSNLKLF